MTFGQRCQCCGVTGAGRTLVIIFGAETRALCELCEGLEQAGLVRRETVDGEIRYRKWKFEWTPGELVPKRPG